MNKNSLYANEELYHGEFLTSLNGNYKAMFQSDCNLVIYGDSALWHSDTAQSTGVRIVLQDDGQFVMYTKGKTAVWYTDSSGKQSSPRIRLTLTDRGHLQITRDGDLIWTSEKSKGIKL